MTGALQTGMLYMIMLEHFHWMAMIKSLRSSEVKLENSIAAPAKHVARNKQANCNRCKQAGAKH